MFKKLKTFIWGITHVNWLFDEVTRLQEEVSHVERQLDEVYNDVKLYAEHEVDSMIYGPDSEYADMYKRLYKLEWRVDELEFSEK